MSAIIRNVRPSDFEAIKKIHEDSKIDYQFPNLRNSLFLVKKVIEVEGVVRVAGATYVQVECYLWLDKSDWADADEKYAAVKLIEDEVLRETALKGAECAVLYLPPGMERFGKRLEKDLHFSPLREGWMAYAKELA